ncbi:hypothetical protein CEXT_108521 [Caerostris extrusa]|uniref:Uncharacterized protein n=1 Tax=Caerostris extrusa TaxID=172846 RepID=A0AAV4SQL4_CAEEX|nr:hypothetical protein CEXT_108521 [Caerostris extrusa]
MASGADESDPVTNNVQRARCCSCYKAEPSQLTLLIYILGSSGIEDKSRQSYSNNRLANSMDAFFAVFRLSCWCIFGFSL